MRPCWFQLRKVKKNIWTFGWSWLYSNRLLIWWRVIFLFTSTDMIYWNCTLLGSVPPHPRFTAFKVEILQSAAGCCQPIRVQSGHHTKNSLCITCFMSWALIYKQNKWFSVLTELCVFLRFLIATDLHNYLNGTKIRF